MRKQIDELMALADAYAATPMWTNADQNRATLRAALEAALKPGVPDRYVWEQYMDHCNGMGWIERVESYDPRTPEYAELHPGVYWDDPTQVRNFRALYTAAPPAQTPPRLTELEVNEIYNKWVQGTRDGTTFTGAIQDAVRRQSGVQE